MASGVVKSASSSSSLDSENSGKLSNDEVVSEMSGEFNKFLNLNMEKEEKKFNDSVEMMLTKLDEFFSLVDMIRSDTTLCLSTTVPDIQAKCQEIEAVFEKIDKLEDFVAIVRECVSATEEKVNKAETDLGAVGGLVKKLTSFVSKKKNPAHPRGGRTDYVPVNIFSTDQFFDHSQDSAMSPPKDVQDELASSSSSS
ncbi:biogenesis of lysosome-related organelles complex 1 subunit 4 [Aplysia californica]|uniref:Biogenesis of lysosome-related organelles complex 1 subunit 4 n=1 Tax=Aplysia californica TaxID=6500 RepID=A0ABM0K8D6_APLCA|nr:biogenesis of lysosome-related organelles complex 1 subunit 4 [Aplysia californica]